MNFLDALPIAADLRLPIDLATRKGLSEVLA